MAFVLSDRVKETTTTTGTGDVTLAGAVTGFEAFSARMSNGDTTTYCITDGTDWEVGLGTWNTGGTLSRTTVYKSSNSDSAVSFASGTKTVFMDTLSDGLPFKNTKVSSVATLETTTSTSYTDLTTSGPAVTITVRGSGILLINFAALLQQSGANQESRMSFALSGANTLAANDTNGIIYLGYGSNTYGMFGRSVLLTGLTPGSTTVTAKYRVNAGTGTFQVRELSAIAL